MEHKSTYLVLSILVFAINLSHAQSGPEFPDCSDTPLSMCVSDPGVRLPANNRIYLGENDPNASSCSVHVTQSIKIKADCGSQVQYEVQLFLHDTSAAYTLQSLTSVATDSIGGATLTYDSETSPESFISENGIPYTTGCMPYHRIKWIVTDSCNHISECDQLINIYGCQAPVSLSPPNIIQTIVLPPGCGLHLYAKDFSPVLLDDCTSEIDFSYSLKESEYLPDQYYDPCSVPYGVETTLDFWIADIGNDLDCSGSIGWDERSKYKQTARVVYDDHSGGACLECIVDIVLHGEILTQEVLEPVELVKVYLSSPGHQYPTFTTGENGQYEFHQLLAPSEITISAERNDNHKNGVSTLDLVRIQKHLLGIESLPGPYYLIAADANNSQSVSAIDMVEIRKLILGINNTFPNNKSWRFVDKGFVFQDTMNPWPFKEIITSSINDNIIAEDFVGIKIGDVNNTVQANAQVIKPRQAHSTFLSISGLTEYQADELVEINLRPNDLKALQGFQFTISDPDLQFISASSDLPDFSDDNFALFGDKMTFSWFTLDPLSWTNTQPILTIRAKATKPGNLNSLQINSDITDAEVYDQGETLEPKLFIEVSDQDNLELILPEPNPWKENCVIPFYTPDDGTIVFQVFNVAGEEAYSVEQFYPRGYHQIEMMADDFSSDGLMFFTLQNGKEARSGKMVVLR